MHINISRGLFSSLKLICAHVLLHSRPRFVPGAEERRAEGSAPLGMSVSHEQASRALPKTGIDQLDCEACIVYSSLSRIGEALSGPPPPLPVTRVISPAKGLAINVSHRTRMGAAPDVALNEEEDGALVEQRSEVEIAHGALMRLMKLTSTALGQLEALQGNFSSTNVSITGLTQKVDELTTKCAEQSRELAALQDPNAAFQHFQRTLSHQYKVDREAVTATLSRQEGAAACYVSKLQEAKRAAAAVKKRSRIFEVTRSRLALELDSSEAALSHLLDCFRPPQISVRADSCRGDDEKDHELTDHSDREEDDNPVVAEDQPCADVEPPEGTSQPQLTPETRAIEEEAAATANNAVQRIKGLSIEGVLADLDGTTKPNPSDTAEPGVKAEGEGDAQPYEAIVITRQIADKTRTFHLQDPSATLIGALLNVFLYAPSTFAVLNVDMKTTTGRSQQLTQQAEACQIGCIWDALHAETDPAIVCADCPVPGSAKDVPFEPQPHIMEYPYDEFLRSCDEKETLRCVREQQLEKVLRLKRLPPTSASSSPSKVLSPRSTSGGSTPRLVNFRPQHGVVHRVGRRMGSEQEWSSPITWGAVRCYASSMFQPCKTDALIEPFHDFHTPYFTTGDAVGQHVTVVFERMLLIPHAYSFASTHPVHGGAYPRHWRLDASLDGLQWETLRRHTQDETLDRYHPIAVFTLPRECHHRFFQQFRIVHEGLNALGTNELSISSIEFFGRLIYVESGVPRSSITLPRRTPRRFGFAPFSALPVTKAPVPLKKKKAAPKRR